MRALDIETSCAVLGCPGHKCEHGLNPLTGKIDVVAVWSPEEKRASAELFELPDQYVGHNLSFDFRWLMTKGIDLDLDQQLAHDTMLMAYVHRRKVDAGWLESYDTQRKILNKERGPDKVQHRDAGGLSLKTLAPYFLGVPAFWEPEGSHNDLTYALTDTEYTYRLYEFFKKEMSEQEWIFYETKMLPWYRMLIKAEHRGITIDPERLAKLKAQLQADEVSLREELDNLWHPAHVAYTERKIQEVNQAYAEQKSAGTPAWEKRKATAIARVEPGFSYDSPSQMAWFLRDYKELDIRDVSGAESTGKAVLTRLAAQGNEDVGKFLKYRKAQKILTGFIPDYEERLKISPTVNPHFHITGTRTGRLSGSNPNLQQVSKGLKHLFVPRPGYKFIGHDAAAIEAKLIAWYSEDPTLCEFIMKGESIHNLNVNVFFNLDTPLSEVAEKHPNERRVVKNCFFALCYGAGPNRIYETMLAGGFDTGKHEAKRIYDNVKRAYPQLFKFHAEVNRMLQSGETLYNILGRPIYPENLDNIFMQGFNTLVQSSASDLNLEGASKAAARWKAAGLDSTLLLFVHDFVLAEVREDHVEEADRILIEELTRFDLHVKDGTIKLTLDGGVSDEWRG